MTKNQYDAIVVGARYAGSPTAMLLARKGYKVLVIDRAKPKLLCGYNSYWSRLPMDGRFEVYDRPDRGWAAAPTHDGDARRGRLARTQSSRPTRRTSKATTSRCSTSPRNSPSGCAAPPGARFARTAVSNFFRKPFGPGWALVGDARAGAA
jgi:choline dehydrogenase-like flavoprotein